MWTQDERGRSSTWRKLSAIEFLLLSCLPILRASHVKWYTENQTTAKIGEVGSMKLELHTLALNIFKLCYENGIHLDIEWVPKDCNTRADLIANWWTSMTGRSLRMSSKTWIVSGVPIQWIVLPQITTERLPDIFLDFGTRKRRASTHYLCSHGK